MIFNYVMKDNFILYEPLCIMVRTNCSENGKLRISIFHAIKTKKKCNENKYCRSSRGHCFLRKK